MFCRNNNTLVMLPTGTTATICGDILCILCAVVCSTLYVRLQNLNLSDKDLVHQVCNGQTVNIISPMIHQLPTADKKNIRSIKCVTDTQSNITVHNFSFAKLIWECLIPIMY